VELQRQTLKLAEARYKAGTTAKLDVLQARSTLEQTEAQIPELEISLRQANNQLCVLLAIPPEELRSKISPGHILTAPAEVAAGIPAELLRRRPDVRRAERQAAAQSAQIGVAEAELYPHISITGTINYAAGTPLLPRPAALGGPVAPTALEGNIGSQRWSDADFAGPTLSVMNTSRWGNCSNCEAGLPKFVASTSGGLPPIHSDRSMSS
jgi:outer membrane protein TolC